MKKIVMVCVVAACGLVFAGQKEDISAAIARGVKFLQSKQEADGHFSDPHMPALTALPLWALVSGGQGQTEGVKIADLAYVLETGNITMSGTGAELLANDKVKEAYLGKHS